MATPANEGELLTFALKTTAARVEERCHELRCGTAASTDDASWAQARRELWMARDPARGVVRITVELVIGRRTSPTQTMERLTSTSMSALPRKRPQSTHVRWRRGSSDEEYLHYLASEVTDHLTDSSRPLPDFAPAA